MSDRPTRVRSGFSMLEVLLCATLLVLMVVPLLGFLDRLVHRTAQTRTRSVARSLARSVLERYRVERLAELSARLTGFDAGSRAIAVDPLLELPAGPLAELVRASGMRRSARLERLAGPGAATRRTGRLTARVDWSEDGHARRFELSTLVIDDELVTGWLEEGA